MKSLNLETVYVSLIRFKRQRKIGAASMFAQAIRYPTSLPLISSKQSPRRGPTFSPPVHRGRKHCAYRLEAPPLPTPLNLACGNCDAARCTPVDKVTQRNECKCQSNHRTPSFQLTIDTDSHVTPQMLVRSVALKVGLAGVNMSLVSLIRETLDAILARVSSLL